MSSKSRAVSAKGAADFKPSITRAIPLNAVILVLITLELEHFE